VKACDWAACDLLAHAHEGGYWHCQQHHRQHLEEFPPDTPPQLQHGTHKAYVWHRSRDEQPCLECRVWQSAKNARHYAAKAARKKAA
jgi:hypothetical protein